MRRDKRRLGQVPRLWFMRRRLSAAAPGRFGEPAFWREFYARKSGPFEWFVDADVAARALQPLLPRSQGGGCRVLHLGCGTSALGPLLAEQGHAVVNVDYDRGCLEAASAQFGSRAEWALRRVEESPQPTRDAAHT